MVGWRHRLDGHEFEQDPGAGDGQGGLVCCSPWGSSGKNTGVGCHFLLQEIFLTQGSNPRPPLGMQILFFFLNLNVFLLIGG